MIAAVLFALSIGGVYFFTVMMYVEGAMFEDPGVLLVYAGVCAVLAVAFGALYVRGLERGRQAVPPHRYLARRLVFGSLLLVIALVCGALCTEQVPHLYRYSDDKKLHDYELKRLAEARTKAERAERWYDRGSPPWREAQEELAYWEAGVRKSEWSKLRAVVGAAGSVAFVLAGLAALTLGIVRAPRKVEHGSALPNPAHSA
jgi:hypothetical protein